MPESVPWPRVQVDAVADEQPIPSVKTSSQITQSVGRSTHVAAVAFFLFSLFLLAICAWLLWRVWGLAREVRALRSQESQRRVMGLSPDSVSPLSQNMSLLQPTPTASPSTSVSITPIPSPTVDPITRLPVDWEKFAFPDLKIVMYAPPGFKSDLQLFDSGEYLVRFWQTGDAASSPIQLTIKPNWDNTGDSQQQPRTIKANQGFLFSKVDPPTKSAAQLDHYQTNYFFAYSSKVYYLTCKHDWNTTIYSQCETMMKALELNS